MTAPSFTPGPLALVGGDELSPGNESQDRVLVAAAGGGPAFVLATAAGRGHPEMAVRHAVEWFAGLGLSLGELPAIRRRDVHSASVAARALTGRCFYLVGGDPGRVPTTLTDTPVWRAIVTAWSRGAALAGSSAGAMALGAWTLIRDRHPGDASRAYRPGLAVVPNTAVIPHFDTFGAGWVETSLAGRPREDAVLVGIDERTAALWQDGIWQAYGPGAVIVFTGGDRTRYEEGEIIAGIPQPTSDTPTDRVGT
ncbi:MAG: Type 1 glutamine amidotransferase-like domain-containing protein [Actinomycetota bacterium]